MYGRALLSAVLLAVIGARLAACAERGLSWCARIRLVVVLLDKSGDLGFAISA